MILKRTAQFMLCMGPLFSFDDHISADSLFLVHLRQQGDVSVCVCARACVHI